MRELTAHNIPGKPATLKITVQDEPGPGNACHSYRIVPATPADGNFAISRGFGVDIDFQKGPIREAGVNGVTIEALLAVSIDQLVGFQDGPYNCSENAAALRHLIAALEVLKDRTKARIRRGVEGTSQQ